MGIRFFNLHTIPWCFHLMGNYSCIQLQPEPQVEIIKLIKSDGVVKIYDRPIHVSDLMLEFPKHLVCRSDSFYIGQKIPALSEQDRLQLGETYFLLPQQFFQSVLSFVTIASFAAASSKLQSSSSSPTSLKDSRAAFLKKANSCQPFDIQKSPTGCLRIRVSDEFISQLMEQGKFKENEGDGCGGSSAKSKSKVCTTPQLEKDYSKLVGSRLWKPKLEPIKEKEMRKFASFGIQRSKKFSSFSQSNETQMINTGKVSASSLCSSAYRKTSRSWSEQHFHSTPTTKTCSKIRMRIRSRKP